MQRIRVPGGCLEQGQWHALADVTARDLTVDEVLARLRVKEAPAR